MEDKVKEILEILEDWFKKPAESAGLVWSGNFAYMAAKAICQLFEEEAKPDKIEEALECFGKDYFGKMELFWRISQQARIGLMQYQAQRHNLNLEIAAETPPWLQEKPPWKIPVSVGMAEEELEAFMKQKPKHPAGRGYKP